MGEGRPGSEGGGLVRDVGAGPQESAAFGLAQMARMLPCRDSSDPPFVPHRDIIFSLCVLRQSGSHR